MAVEVHDYVVRSLHTYARHRSRNHSAAAVDDNNADQRCGCGAQFAWQRRASRPRASDPPGYHAQHD
ncbi:MAG: hypothetical protein ACHQQP_02635, partial [Gemmatimonadales bacterium]